MRRLDLYQRTIATGIVPLFYQDDSETARSIVDALVDGGAVSVEFTNRGPAALRVFRELAAHVAARHPSVALGVGSVVDAPTAGLFVAEGADFIVSPTFTEEVIVFCNRRKIAYVPGCATANEIRRAEEHGAEIVKYFPGGIGGPAFIKAVLAPMPWTSIMPTGGVSVSEESIGAWIGAGAVCVGLGSGLVKKDLVAAGDFAGISRLMAEAIDLVRAARG